MPLQKNIIECYNKTAKNYAASFKDELNKKHFDRILLNAFALENINKGRLIDLGCGPGHTTKYLNDCGIEEIVGVDISPGMIGEAKKLFPSIHYEEADILNLQYPDKGFGSAIAFYAIVHFDRVQLKSAFMEINRILSDNGQFLFSFHIGDQIIHLDDFLDHKVSIDFNFFETSLIINLLHETNFEIIDVMERHPYEDVEYPSKRAYIWANVNLRRY